MSKEFKDNVLQDEKETLEQEVESPSETVAAEPVKPAREQEGETPPETAAAEPEEPARRLEEALAAAQEEAEDLRDRMLRIAAESENFKKRMERERATALKYAGEQIFREILPVVDNLERAIVHCDELKEGDVETNFTGLLEGVQLTLKSLVATLEKFEVKAVVSVGQEFDPNHQEALTMEASDTIPANHVTAEFEKGYYYKDRLLRAAKVIVSSGPAKG